MTTKSVQQNQSVDNPFVASKSNRKFFFRGILIRLDFF